jgi:serine/threonine protein kinase
MANETAIELVLHPAHVQFCRNQRAQPLLTAETELSSEGFAEKFQELQRCADEEVAHLGKLTEVSPFHKARLDSGGVIVSIPGQTPTELVPFCGQLAYSTAGEAHECPQAGGNIVGVVAIGCPPPSANLTLQHFHLARSEETGCIQSAVWLFLAVASGRAPRPAAHWMREVADALTQIGYIRNDFSQRYQLRDHLGDGSFARVYAARRIVSQSPSDQHLAAKVARTSTTTASVATEAFHLISCQSHPNIIKFWGLFCTAQGWTMLLEGCSDGDLKDYVFKNRKGFAEETGLHLVGKGLFAGLSFVHARGLIHRDVKPENVLIDRLPDAALPHRTVLTDFGITCHTSNHEKMGVRCGSAGSVAPEVLRHTLHSQKSDVFSGGVTLYYALGAKMPFRGPDLSTTLRENARARVRFGRHFNTVSELTKDALRSFMFNDPARRPSSLQVLEHINQLYDLLGVAQRSASAPALPIEQRDANVEGPDAFPHLGRLALPSGQHTPQTSADLQSASGGTDQPLLVSEYASTGLQTSGDGSDQTLLLVSESASTGLPMGSERSQPLLVIAPASPKPKRQSIRNAQHLERARQAEGISTSTSTCSTVSSEASSASSNHDGSADPEQESKMLGAHALSLPTLIEDESGVSSHPVSP